MAWWDNRQDLKEGNEVEVNFNLGEKTAGQRGHGPNEDISSQRAETLESKGRFQDVNKLALRKRKHSFLHFHQQFPASKVIPDFWQPF